MKARLAMLLLGGACSEGAPGGVGVQGADPLTIGDLDPTHRLTVTVDGRSVTSPVDHRSGLARPLDKPCVPSWGHQVEATRTPPGQSVFGVWAPAEAPLPATVDVDPAWSTRFGAERGVLFMVYPDPDDLGWAAVALSRYTVTDLTELGLTVSAEGSQHCRARSAAEAEAMGEDLAGCTGPHTVVLRVEPLEPDARRVAGFGVPEVETRFLVGGAPLCWTMALQ